MASRSLPVEKHPGLHIRGEMGAVKARVTENRCRGYNGSRSTERNTPCDCDMAHCAHGERHQETSFSTQDHSAMSREQLNARKLVRHAVAATASGAGRLRLPLDRRGAALLSAATAPCAVLRHP